NSCVNTLNIRKCFPLIFFFMYCYTGSCIQLDVEEAGHPKRSVHQASEPIPKKHRVDATQNAIDLGKKQVDLLEELLEEVKGIRKILEERKGDGVLTGLFQPTAPTWQYTEKEQVQQDHEGTYTSL
ncbi:unnamed protein product, partial [Owenia fusiformis]